MCMKLTCESDTVTVNPMHYIIITAQQLNIIVNMEIHYYRVLHGYNSNGINNIGAHTGAEGKDSFYIVLSEVTINVS